MESIANELNRIIRDYLEKLRAISKEQFNYKPSPLKWSKKEILGHLVDSAQNNIRRFIMAQYELRPKIVYNQDKWVALSNYQEYNSDDLITLWYHLNEHICHILRGITAQMADREVETENVHSLKWLASDYMKHLLHHLHQMLELEPVAYP